MRELVVAVGEAPVDPKGGRTRLDGIAVLGGLDIEGQSNLRRRLLWMTTVVAGLMYQQHERIDRRCAQYFDALRRQQNPDLAKLTATVIAGYSRDVGECQR